MRFVKLFVVALVLGLSGQAWAAKTIVTGTATTNASGQFIFNLPIAWFNNSIDFESSIPMATFVRTNYTETLCYQHRCPEPSFTLDLVKETTKLRTTHYSAIYGTGFWWTWYHRDRSKVINSEATATLFARTDPFTNFSYSLTYAPIPEPSTWALMILGFGAVGGALRKRRTVLASAAPSVADGHFAYKRI